MIAIKNIKMPVNCEECFARILAWCLLDEEERMVIPALPDVSFEGRPDWCPLVEVPDMNVGKCSEIPNSSDCISRRDALALWDKYHYSIAIHAMEYDEELRSLPSVQPERLTDDDFETIRIHLSAYKERLCNQRRWKEAEEYQRIINRFMNFASAQPEADLQADLQSTCNQLATERYEDLCEYFGNQRDPILTDRREFKRWLDRVKWHVKKVDELARRSEDEWCTDCPAYDHEKHHCPRFNRVIRKTVDEIREENKWTPCSKELPKEDGDYLVTLEKGFAEDYGSELVIIMNFEVDCESFGYWDESFDPHTLGSLGSDWVEIPVTAWKPLSEPYRGE